MHDIIVIGNSTLDVFLEIHEASVHCNLNKSKCFLCLNYADKIPVEKITRTFGGNAANFAVGVSRSGIKTAIYTVLGQDEVGKNIFDNFKKENIMIDYVEFDKDKQKHTNYSTIIDFQGERTILVFHETRESDLPLFKKAGWLYLTSLSADFEKPHQQVIDYLKNSDENVKLVFNPGVNELRGGLDKLKNILAVAQVLILNKEEAQRLLGQGDIKNLMKEFVNLGVSIVAITDAENGSYAFDGENFFEQHAEKVTLIERTGAGDAYSAGLVAALILNKDLKQAMQWGARNAASVVQYIGSQQGLLRNLELPD